MNVRFFRRPSSAIFNQVRLRSTRGDGIETRHQLRELLAVYQVQKEQKERNDLKKQPKVIQKGTNEKVDAARAAEDILRKCRKAEREDSARVKKELEQKTKKEKVYERQKQRVLLKACGPHKPYAVFVSKHAKGVGASITKASVLWKALSKEQQEKYFVRAKINNEKREALIKGWKNKKKTISEYQLFKSKFFPIAYAEALGAGHEKKIAFKLAQETVTEKYRESEKKLNS